MRHDDLWAIEYAGGHFGPARDKNEVKATANKRARQMQGGGQACLVRVIGENGYFGG